MKVQTAIKRLTVKDPSNTWLKHSLWLKKYIKWRLLVKREYEVNGDTRGTFLGIIQNYKRPYNTQPIVLSLLATPAIGQVIVSNNNPRCDINRWFNLKHKNVKIIEQEKECSTAERFRIARNNHSEFYLAIDDDLFLTPLQLQKICDSLIANPKTPHGICGQSMQEDGSFIYNIHGKDCPVDGINRLYAFTNDHLKEFFRITEQLGITEESDMWYKSLWDDMAISMSGYGKPCCLNVDEYLDCPTQSNHSAAWKQKGFFEYRENFYKRLISAKYSK
ncbi:hypothetical protein KJ652_02370 [Patescibacteria group bacterium]|nr:hypothetical protein [Patescibacteria group bacterium]MBU1123411.1 hypothetical protein [Patescibacteria group bacterium]MBU1911382.1 hypothetical protein [Patescibacteria group bacterium]